MALTTIKAPYKDCLALEFVTIRKKQDLQDRLQPQDNLSVCSVVDKKSIITLLQTYT